MPDTPQAAASRSNVSTHFDEPAPAAWRQTIQAIQALAPADTAVGLPLIHKLMTSPAQPYQVHAVAAWRLGRSGYMPARADLEQCAHAAESNLAHRARWGMND